MSGTGNILRRGFIGALVVVATLFLAPTAAFAQVGEVEDLVDEAQDKVNDTVDDTTDAVDDATGGASEPATDLVDETVGQANEATDDVRDKVRDTTKPVVDTVQDTIRQQLGTDDPASGRAGADDPQVADPRTDDRFRSGSGTRTTAGVLSDSLRRGSERSSDIGSTGTTTPVQPSFFQRFVERASELATALAFPIALLLLVAAFLAIQSRMDRSDPKLALALLDQDQEFVSFN